MAEDTDKSSQTEQPTQRRLDQAAEHGDIVKSQEVTTFVAILGGAVTLAIFGHSTAQGFLGTFHMFLEQPDQIAVDSTSIMVLFRAIIFSLFALFAPVFGLIAAMGLAGHVLQARPSIALDRIKPNFGKISPLGGLKRMFGLDGLTNLGKGLLKIAIVGSVVWTVLWPERGNLEGYLTQSPVQIGVAMAALTMKLLIAVLSVLAIIALLDYLYQHYRFMQRNMMSKQEIKEEFRQSDGDPAIKAKIRQVRMERSKRRMMAAVPEATVIITNPTHYAVALKYESGKMAAPICVAKGMDALALKIREVAQEHDIPIIENPPLARALYAAIDLDEPVPAEHFKAVAQVIGYVMRLNGKIKAN
jgi:flagellar biosynthetic protein FlhB